MWDDKNYIQELWTNGKNKIWDGLILEPKTLYYQPGGLLLYSSPLYPFQIGRGIDKIMNTIRYTVTHLVPFHLCYYNHLSLAPNFFMERGICIKKYPIFPICANDPNGMLKGPLDGTSIDISSLYTVVDVLD